MTRYTNIIERGKVFKNARISRTRKCTRMFGLQTSLLVLCIYFLQLVPPSSSKSSSFRTVQSVSNNNTTTTTSPSSSESKDPSSLSVLNNGRDSKSPTEGILSQLGLQASLVDNDDLPEDKTFFGEDSNGNPIVIGTWFQYGSYTLATAMFTIAFLIACAATAIYYVLFVVTEPTQMRRRRRDSDEGGLTLTTILKTLSLAYDTYERLNGLNN